MSCGVAWHGSAHRPPGSPAFAASRRSALGPSRDRQRRIDGQSQPSLWPARSTRKRTGPLGRMIPPFEARRIASIGFAIGLVAKEVTDSHGRASYPSASCPAAIYRATSQAFVVPKSENRSRRQARAPFLRVDPNPEPDKSATAQVQARVSVTATPWVQILEIEIVHAKKFTKPDNL